jgi:hypothetical protein
LIVGRTIASLLYAWRLQEKCILEEPFCFHWLSDEFDNIDFSEFNVQNSEQFCQNLFIIMGITNLLMYPGRIATYREEDNVVITKDNTRIQLKDKPKRFDGKNLGINQVFDEFYWRAGQAHDRTLVQTEDNFCNRIYFYETQRHSVHKSVKDFTVASYLTDSELLSPDWGNGMTRIKTHRIFKSEDIKGEFAWQRGDKRYHKKVKFDFVDRKVLPRIEQKMTFKEVYDMKQKEGKEWIMWKKLTSQEKTWLG